MLWICNNLHSKQKHLFYLTMLHIQAKMKAVTQGQPTSVEGQKCSQMAVCASEAQKKHLVTRHGGILHNTSTQEAKDGDPYTQGQPGLRREILLQDRVRIGREKSRKHIVLDRSFRHVTGWVSENETPKSSPGTC